MKNPATINYGVTGARRRRGGQAATAPAVAPVKLSKIRSDSSLAKLTLAQKEEIFAWLSGGLGYDDARQRIAREFKIRTSTGSLSNFWSKFCAPRLLANTLQEIALSDETLFAIVIEVMTGNRVAVHAVRGPKGFKA